MPNKQTASYQQYQEKAPTTKAPVFNPTPSSINVAARAFIPTAGMFNNNTPAFQPDAPAKASPPAPVVEVEPEKPKPPPKDELTIRLEKMADGEDNIEVLLRLAKIFEKEKKFTVEEMG